MTYDTAATDPHHSGKLTFDMWIERLETIMGEWERQWGNLPYTLPLKESTGLACWLEMYDDGLTPLHAFWEDQESWSE